MEGTKGEKDFMIIIVPFQYNIIKLEVKYLKIAFLH
jgi:hypothetical protein